MSQILCYQVHCFSLGHRISWFFIIVYNETYLIIIACVFPCGVVFISVPCSNAMEAEEGDNGIARGVPGALDSNMDTAPMLDLHIVLCERCM